MATNFVLGNRRKAVGSSEGEEEGATMTMIGRRSSRVLDSDELKLDDEVNEKDGLVKAGLDLKIDDEKEEKEKKEPKEKEPKEGERKSLRRRSLGRPTSSQIMAGELDKERERVEKEKREKKDQLLNRMGPQTEEKDGEGANDKEEGSAVTNSSSPSASTEDTPMRLGQAGKKKSASRMVVTQPQVAKRKDRTDSDVNEVTREMVADSPQRRERPESTSRPRADAKEDLIEATRVEDGDSLVQSGDVGVQTASSLVSQVANTSANMSASALARESVSQAYSNLDSLEKFTIYFDAKKAMKKNIISKSELQKPLKEVLAVICTLRGIKMEDYVCTLDTYNVVSNYDMDLDLLSLGYTEVYFIEKILSNDDSLSQFKRKQSREKISGRIRPKSAAHNSKILQAVLSNVNFDEEELKDFKLEFVEQDLKIDDTTSYKRNYVDQQALETILIDLPYDKFKKEFQRLFSLNELDDISAMFGITSDADLIELLCETCSEGTDKALAVFDSLLYPSLFNEYNSAGEAAVHVALKRGNIDFLLALLNSQNFSSHVLVVEPPERNRFHLSPLQFALTNGRIDIFLLLCTHFIQSSFRSRDFYFSLFEKQFKEGKIALSIAHNISADSSESLERSLRSISRAEFVKIFPSLDFLNQLQDRSQDPKLPTRLFYVSQEALEPPWKFEKRLLVTAQGDESVASLLEREKIEWNDSTAVLRDGFNFDVSRASRLDSLCSAKIILLTKGSKRESATPRQPFSVWPGDLLSKEGRCFVRAADRRAFGSTSDAIDGASRTSAGYRHSQGRLGGGPRGLGLKMPGSVAEEDPSNSPRNSSIRPLNLGFGRRVEKEVEDTLIPPPLPFVESDRIIWTGEWSSVVVNCVRKCKKCGNEIAIGKAARSTYLTTKMDQYGNVQVQYEPKYVYYHFSCLTDADDCEDSERSNYAGQLFWSSTSKPVDPQAGDGSDSHDASPLLSRSSSGSFNIRPGSRTHSSSSLVVSQSATSITPNQDSPQREKGELAHRTSKSDLLDSERSDKSLNRSSGVKRRKEKKEKSLSTSVTPSQLSLSQSGSPTKPDSSNTVDNVGNDGS